MRAAPVSHAKPSMGTHQMKEHGVDPNAVLNDMITAVMKGALSEAKDRLNELRIWRNQGGFAPKDPWPGPPQQLGANWPICR